MIDINFIRKHVNDVKQAILNRNQHINVDNLLMLDNNRKILIKKIENLRMERNQLSKKHFDNYTSISVKVKIIKKQIKEYNNKLLIINKKIMDMLLCMPNLPDASVPIGSSSKQNKIVKYVNSPKNFLFIPKPHWEIGERLNILDFTTASKISGSRFVILKNEGCVLERAIISFFIDTHKKHGYSEIMAPYLVNKTSMVGTGQLPKFEDEVFTCTKDNLYLIPTSEVSITNIYRNSILHEYDLPKKYVSYSACFRRESGSYGRDTKGLIRNHQFNKVELVKFVKPIDSNTELDRLLVDAEYVLQLLNLPYRISLLSSGDMSFASSKTYDIEVWFASTNTYKEISSCSNFKNFQSKRMNIKIQYPNKQIDFVHTLNGSGLAVGRTFAALLEYFQNQDGSINIPEVLQKYTGFRTIPAK
ncbi:MAG: serine--tRNA ligase [Endomicrobium sp.]|jgi:seryl-tRNA synthetase|nr:serine--tRNA ligase [Endomicrobium sp.]